MERDEEIIEDQQDGSLESILEEDAGAPQKIVGDVNPMALDFHPTQNNCVVGWIDGSISFHLYEASSTVKLFDLSYHTSSCRVALFSTEGNRIFTGSADKSLAAVDVETQKLLFRKTAAHKDGINAMIIQDSNIITGDDDGTIKVWDIRQQKETHIWKLDDYVSDFALVPGTNTLLAASGDCTLSVLNTRSGKTQAQAESADELLSLLLMRDGTRVVCGTQQGLLEVWNYGSWEDSIEKVRGHPESVNTMVKIDEESAILRETSKGTSY
eukprot:TRINITY_DN2689_c0_g1_i1.p1 TRINITY_DN2689_c0_g1~~TRINITY_DN2689_c0_g1_i1.p1  ORF type:complete len:269 (-),score=58.13 TRINITY_DN2689_c0_g1_i1:46-852(-)